MAVYRSFIALELSNEIHQQLERVIAELKAMAPQHAVRWVSATNIHLTLKFLGDVSTSNLEVLKKMIMVESSLYAPFDISVGGLGAFPSIHRPHVIWVGVSAPETLTALQHSIEHSAARLGYPPENRAFSPHLTLGRMTRNAPAADIGQIGQVLRGYNIGFLGAVRIQAVHLFRSVLSPQGAHYTRLSSAELTQSPKTN